MSNLPEPKINVNCSSPIGRLPLDVLHVIFDITRRDPRSATPFTLSHVCHEWRSFLFASPLLWTIIIIERTPLPDLKYYDLWLERLQPLDLSLYIKTSSLDMPEKNVDSFFRVICGLSSYCKEVEVPDISSPLDAGFNAIRVWLELAELPKLTTLHLPLFGVDHLTQTKLGIASMPNLESLDIPGGLFRLSPHWFSACRQLRRLHLTYDDLVHPSALLSFLHRIILSISTQLEDLRIHVPGDGHILAQAGFPGGRVQVVEMPKHVILLPRLTKLSLSWGENNSGGRFFCGLFRVLRAPKLLGLLNLSISTLVKETPLGHYPELRLLGLTGHSQDEAVTSLGIPSFNTSQLESLYSVQFSFITWQDGDFATLLLRSCPQLVVVRLYQCSSVRETDLRRLVEGRKASEELATLLYLGALNCKPLELDEEALAWFEWRLETFEYVL